MKLEDLISTEHRDPCDVSYRGDIVAGKYRFIIFAGGKLAAACPNTPNLPIDNYSSYELYLVNENTNRPASWEELKIITGVNCEPYRHVHKVNATHVPRDVFLEIIEKLEKAAGNDCANPETCGICHICQKPQPCPNHPLLAKAVCPECGGKKILDFGFYQRDCMRCK